MRRCAAAAALWAVSAVADTPCDPRVPKTNQPTNALPPVPPGCPCGQVVLQYHCGADMACNETCTNRPCIEPYCTSYCSGLCQPVPAFGTSFKWSCNNNATVTLAHFATLDCTGPQVDPGQPDSGVTCEKQCNAGPNRPVTYNTYFCALDPSPGCSSTPAPPAPTPAPTAPPKCSVNLDLLFVLDASKSIKQTNWAIDLDITQQIANNFTFGCTADPKVGGAEAEMGIIEFATDAQVVQPLTCDKAQFIATAKSLKQPCESGDSTCHGWTYTGDALAQAYNVFKTSGRPDDVKLIILITDGVPCTPDDPMSGAETCRSTIPDPKPSQAQSAKAMQWSTSLKTDLAATIATIAVGDFGTYGQQFIDKISSTPSSKYVFNPSSWSDLPALIQTIIASICPPSPVAAGACDKASCGGPCKGKDQSGQEFVGHFMCIGDNCDCVM